MFTLDDMLVLQTQSTKNTNQYLGDITEQDFSSVKYPTKYAYVGNDPVNASDPTGTSGKGGDWDDGDWRRFKGAQDGAVRKVKRAQSNISEAREKGGRKLRRLRRQIDKIFGEGASTDANLDKLEESLAGMAFAMTDNGFHGHFAYAQSQSQYEAAGGSPSGMARAPIGGKTMFVNVDHDQFTGTEFRDFRRWSIAHESGHSAGLTHPAKAWPPPFATKYVPYTMGVVPNEVRATYDNLTVEEALQNPDKVLEFAIGRPPE